VTRPDSGAAMERLIETYRLILAKIASHNGANGFHVGRDF